MEFEIDDIFETHNGQLWRVSSVIHDLELVWAFDDDEELEFNFSEVATHWKKSTLNA
jgi:hypothetical protein